MKFSLNIFSNRRLRQYLARQVMAYWCEEDLLVLELARQRGIDETDIAKIDELKTQYHLQAQQHEYNLAHELPQETQSTVIKYI